MQDELTVKNYKAGEQVHYHGKQSPYATNGIIYILEVANYIKT